MQCPSCGSKWESKAQVSTCPFCGASLITDTSPILSSVPEVFAYLQKNYGNKVFTESKLTSLLSDFLPNKPKELHLVRVALESGAYAEIIRADELSNSEKQICLEKQRKKLEDYYCLDADWAEKVIHWLSDVLGWSCSQSNSAGSEHSHKNATESRTESSVVQKNSNLHAEHENHISITVGALVSFGSYPRSTNTSEPIMWRVLAVENDKALMISEDLLDCRRFDASSNNWQSSELRAWLNGEFRNKAFNTEEQGKLAEYNGDYVTCLSVEEAKRYFSDSATKQNGFTNCPDRMAKPTTYAKKNGCYVDSDFGTGWWWLRSPGSSIFRAASVNEAGNVGGYGADVFIVSGCVRPVVSVSL